MQTVRSLLMQLTKVLRIPTRQIHSYENSNFLTRKMFDNFWIFTLDLTLFLLLLLFNIISMEIVIDRLHQVLRNPRYAFTIISFLFSRARCLLFCMHWTSSTVRVTIFCAKMDETNVGLYLLSNHTMKKKKFEAYRCSSPLKANVKE